MKARFLTRTNAMITFFLTVLGFGSCNYLQKYGAPEPYLEVKYGAPYDTAEVVALYGVQMPVDEPTLNDSEE